MILTIPNINPKAEITKTKRFIMISPIISQNVKTNQVKQYYTFGSHSFNIEIATELGLETAIILEQIKFLQRMKIKPTIEEVCFQCCYLSEEEVRAAMRKLNELGHWVVDDV